MVAFYNAKDQAIYDRGDKFMSQSKYLQNDYVPTEGISYEGDGSPVSYANSMGGIMTQAPIPGPLKYIPEGDGGGGGGGDDDDDDENKTYDGPSMSPIDAVKNAGMFMLNPLGYLATKAFGAYRSRQKAKADLAADQAYKAKQERDFKEMAANTKNRDGTTAAYNYAGRVSSGGRHDSTVSNEQAQANQDAGRGYKADGGRVGYFFGGRVNYKAGGRTDAGPNRSTASKAGVGQINEAGNKVDGGNYNNNDGGGGIKPSFFNNPEILNKETIIGDIPTGIGFNNNLGRYKAVMDLRNSIKNKNVEGEIEYNNTVGDFNFGGKYDTQDGATYGGSYEKNGVGVEYDNIDGVKASFEKGPFSLSTDGKNYMFNFTLPLGKKNGGRAMFKNGGLASIL